MLGEKFPKNLISAAFERKIAAITKNYNLLFKLSEQSIQFF